MRLSDFLCLSIACLALIACGQGENAKPASSGKADVNTEARTEPPDPYGKPITADVVNDDEKKPDKK